MPSSTDPIIAIEAKAGWAQTAGQDVQISAAENITLASGQDSHWASGGAFRLHTGQSIGMLAGAVQPGTEAAGKGLTLIAAQGDTQIQAQSDTLQIAAKQQLSIQSETANIDWAAAKKITLATAGGASIVIEGGNITVMCPGTITVQASSKGFSGPAGVNYALPALPRSTMKFDEKFQLTDEVGDPLPNMRVRLIKPDGTTLDVVTDALGQLPLHQGFHMEQLKMQILGRVRKGASS